VTATRVTAADEIRAAIDELNFSRRYLAACPEFQYSAVRHVARNCDMEHDCENEGESCGWQYQTAAAFDMLIRTIDAQLAILNYGALCWKTGLIYGPLERHTLALARAINGTEQ
jgi:hypothetical protein